ncbi:MAG TPA: malonyl-ACP O-methyltransferase BioC [Xanthomonadaceae bacterium]|nr:malonyl-ACP O-methyltransferase BioC [Xanthomonadaceae bacterium]
MSGIDTPRLRRAFGRAADGYEAVAALQREVATRLLEQLDAVGKHEPVRVFDLGCGPGGAAQAMHRQWPKAQVLAVDFAMPMLRKLGKGKPWWRPQRRAVQPICADVAALPFVDGSADLLFSSLCLQWVADLPHALTGFRRVLRPGGLLLFSTFGPGTLAELREAFAQADAGDPVTPFAQIQQVGDALQAAGFRDPVLHRDRFTLTYPDVPTLMRELRALGAHNARADRRRSLMGKARMRRVFDAYETLRRDGVLPSTWEVIYAQAFAPQPGQPIREDNGEIARVPMSAIPIRRRGA